MSIIRTLRSLAAVAALALGTAAALAANIEINQAQQADLESIKGIGPTMSERVLAERGKKPFADWADLQARVKGIGAANAARFSAAGLTVGGKAYAADAAPAKAEKPAKAGRAVKPAAQEPSQKS